MPSLADLRRAATFKSHVNETALALEWVGRAISLTHAQLIALGLDTEAKIKLALETAYGGQLTDVFVHINDDGSIAVAIGIDPDFWPEDNPIGLPDKV